MKGFSFTRLAIAAASIALAGCGGQFDSKDVPGIRAAVTGRVFGRDGAAVPGAKVFLLQPGGDKAEAVTGSGGAFSLEAEMAGPVKLVINNGDGRGLVENHTLYAGGTNALGDLVIDRFEHYAEIVTLHGVGFEERLTGGAGHLHANVYSRDVRSAFGYRAKGTAFGFDLVEVSTETGGERVLVSGVQPGMEFYSKAVSFSDEGTDVSPLKLVGERVLIYRVSYDRAGCYDLESGRTIEIPDPEPGAPSSGIHPSDAAWVAGDDLFVVKALSHRPPQVVRIDLQTGLVTFSPPLLGVHETDSIPLALPDARGFFFLEARLCQRDPELDVEDCSVPKGGCVLKRLDLDTMAIHEVVDLCAALGEPSAVTGGSLVEGQADSLFVGWGARLVKVDLVAKSAAVCDGLPYDAARGKVRFPRSAPGNAVLSVAVTGDRLRVEAVRLDGLQPYTITTAATISYRGELLELFPLPEDDPHLAEALAQRVRLLPHGGLRLTTALAEQEPLARTPVMIDTDASGNWTRKRIVPGAADPLSLAESASSPIESVDRYDQGGFNQLLVSDGRSVEAAFTPRTFLRTDHYAGTLSPDGKWLYYTARDPSSGYVQLFRVATE